MVEDASLRSGKLQVVLIEKVNLLLRPDILARIPAKSPPRSRDEILPVARDPGYVPGHTRPDTDRWRGLGASSDVLLPHRTDGPKGDQVAKGLQAHFLSTTITRGTPDGGNKVSRNAALPVRHYHSRCREHRPRRREGGSRGATSSARLVFNDGFHARGAERANGGRGDAAAMVLPAFVGLG